MRVFEGYQKGVNLGGWISQCVSYEKEHFDTFITKADIERLKKKAENYINYKNNKKN